jgi:hypothetical protein
MPASSPTTDVAAVIAALDTTGAELASGLFDLRRPPTRTSTP